MIRPLVVHFNRPLTFLWQPSFNKNNINKSEAKEGIDSFDDFAFGLPSVTSIGNKEFLAVFWNKENGLYGINSIRFKLLR